MESGIDSIKDLVELLASLVVVLGVPAAIFQYVSATRKEQKDREYGTYDALDDKYLEFQRLCLEYPRLDIWDLPILHPVELSEEEKKQELVAFTLLFSIFERAYLMYSDMSTKVKRDQWTGWDEYIQEYSRRLNFRYAWTESGATFDKGFDKYMRGIMCE